MSKKFPKSLIDLRNPVFHDDDMARAHLETILWPDGVHCPRCGVMEDRITKLAGKSTRPGVYKCKDCRKPFSVTVNTVMERSHIPLSKWVMASHLMMASKKGMSALQLHRMLDTTYETAWFLAQRLRECPVVAKPKPMGGKGKTVEMDETFIGGKEKNKHRSKRKHVGTGGSGKEAVFSLVERQGDVRSFHVTNVNARTLRPILFTQVRRDSSLMTDESAVGKGLGSEFGNHESVNHSRGEYARGTAHTNTIESYFAILKRGIYGTFHAVSEQHLSRYLAEFDFRYNHRNVTDSERADALLAGAKGKRLMYHQTNETAH